MNLSVYIISDADGLGISQLAKKTMEKFEVDYKEKSYTNINSLENLDEVLNEIKNNKDSRIIFNSLNDSRHNKDLKTFIEKYNILSIDYTSYSLIKISKFLGIDPIDIEVEDQYQIVHHYKRLDALDFAIKYDDGRDFKGLEYCDICLIGVSRSSKTPLSVYLASIGYKVSNVPLLLDSRVPRELFEIDSKKIFGLTMEKNRLQKIREERLASINLPKNSKYCNIDYIEKELIYANQIMEDLDCKVIDVSNKSIEEASESIISNIENI